MRILNLKKYNKNDLMIYYNCYQTRLGMLLTASTDCGVCYIGFINKIDNKDIIKFLKLQFNKGKFVNKIVDSHLSVIDYFNGKRDIEIPLCVNATDFQLDVWKTLVKIPFATTVSYEYVAKMMDKPNAVRAVSSAIAKNPIAYLIPCHRVVRKNGDIGEYRWGKDKKVELINYEKKLENFGKKDKKT